MTVAENVDVDLVPDSPASLRRIVWSSVIGTAVEWYDFLIYGTATALVFNKIFFAAGNAAMATIAAFGTYAVGFLARPLGAAIFGHYGDRVGRKAMLAITIIVMGLGTFLIGLLPTYQQIGVAAPILLITLRFLQGIGLGGEWGGAVLMVVENCPTHRRGLLGSAVQIGNPIGNIAAIGMFALVASLPESDFLAWGWRIPFLLSVLLVGVGLYIRLRMEETAAFQQVKAKNDIAPMPLVEVFRHHRKPFLIAVGSEDFGDLLCQHRRRVRDVLCDRQSRPVAWPDPERRVSSSLLALAAIPLFGWLSDHLGRKTMFFASCLFQAAFAFPLFWLLNTRDPVIVVLTIIVAVIFGQMVMFGIGAPWYSELFSARLRYSGASLGFQVGAALSGGLTPVIAASLMAWSGGATWPVSVF